MPIQQYSFSSGKNSSDFALGIDAMDLLYQSDIDVFYIVSNDSDFTRLVMRIRESGKVVIGMGEKKALESIVLACNDYIFLRRVGILLLQFQKVPIFWSRYLLRLLLFHRFPIPRIA